MSAASARYAAALLELAAADQQIEPIADELRRIVECWQQVPELRTLVRHPLVTRARRRLLLRAFAQQTAASGLLERTLLLLADRGRLAELPAVLAAYEELADRAAGRLRAEVSSAVDLPEAYFAELRRALEAVSGKSVRLVRHVQPRLLGGVVTRIGNRVWDGSLRGRLAELRQRFTG